MPPKSRGRNDSTDSPSQPTPWSPALPALDSSNHGIAPSRPISSQLRTVASARPPPLNRPSSVPASIRERNDVGADYLSSEQSESESEAEEKVTPTTRRLQTSRSQSQLPRHTASTLFPPFYNRPPTPLPPSPSLKSLLRPTFSAAPSRAATPDSSDIELPTRSKDSVYSTSKLASSSTNLANTARHAPTVPRAAPKVPTYEYYGFAVYMGSSAAFLMYILWAYVPAPMLHQMGIHYYPNRWWALAVPCWLVALVIYIYVALASYNTKYLTLPLNSIENVVDECAQVAVIDAETGEIDKGISNIADRRHSFSAYRFADDDAVDWKALWSTGTDAVMDVPMGGVCEILYGDDD
ncbi:PIG-P-domain-containing protein [Pyrenochaeta sp. DS3sAY3a]|nr:PIG-P-domain-containing protein [Pyrenochaeta sp. DS3sAY3a]